MNELVENITPSNQDEQTQAMLTHLLGILFGIIPSLIFWLINKDNPDRAFLTDQAKEALNFQINVIAVTIVGIILSIILIGILVVFAVAIANLVFCILAGVETSKGRAYRYPSFIIRLIK